MKPINMTGTYRLSGKGTFEFTADDRPNISSAVNSVADLGIIIDRMTIQTGVVVQTTSKVSTKFTYMSNSQYVWVMAGDSIEFVFASYGGALVAFNHKAARLAKV